MKILVVDDQATSRVIVVGHLKKSAKTCGFDVEILEADNADAAWKIYKEQQIDGIITDVFLGTSITGTELVRAIKEENNGKYPAMFVTGISDDDNLSRLWEYGWVVTKPIPHYLYKQLGYFLTFCEQFWKCRGCNDAAGC